MRRQVMTKIRTLFLWVLRCQFVDLFKSAKIGALNLQKSAHENCHVKYAKLGTFNLQKNTCKIDTLNLQ